MNFLAAKLEPINVTLLIFVGCIFVVAVASLLYFFIKNKETKINLSNDSTDCGCNCDCNHANTECHEGEHCERKASCMREEDVNDAFEAFLETKKEESVKEPEPQEEPTVEPVQEEIVTEEQEPAVEVPTTTVPEEKKITREVLLTALKNAGVKGITRLSKQELLDKCNELNIVF